MKVRITVYDKQVDSQNLEVTNIIEISPLTSDVVFRGRIRRALDRQITAMLDNNYVDEIRVEIER